MRKYSILFLPALFFLIISCENKTNNTKNDINYASTTSELSSKAEDSTTLKLTDNTLGSVITNRDTQSFLSGTNVKVDDYIKQYPANQHTELKNHIKQLRKEWENTPNPITASYQGNDFGDYHHIIFKTTAGLEYDFGQAENNYGQYKLHELSGQYDDNPKFLGKKFKVYWGWKLSEFLCCDGEYGKAKAYLPTITKLELINN